MKTKEDLRIIKTKQKVYRALLELLKVKEFENIKVSELCTKSKINRSTFYDHFEDKYELLQAFFFDLKDNLSKNLVKSKTYTNIREYYLDTLKIIFQNIKKEYLTYRSIIQHNNNSIANDIILNIVLTSTIKEIDTNYINNSQIPTKQLALFYVSGLTTIILEYIKNNNIFDEVELTTLIENLLPEFPYMKRKSSQN